MPQLQTDRLDTVVEQLVPVLVIVVATASTGTAFAVAFRHR
jgi:hypothetical protein